MRVFGSTVDLLCAGTSFFCMVLLFRTYIKDRSPLLFWSSACFVGLAINNFLLFLDLVILPATDLRLIRNLAALAAVSVLLYGFIWEADRR